jgi:hypothetical protein
LGLSVYGIRRETILENIADKESRKQLILPTWLHWITFVLEPIEKATNRKWNGWNGIPKKGHPLKGFQKLRYLQCTYVFVRLWRFAVQWPPNTFRVQDHIKRQVMFALIFEYVGRGSFNLLKSFVGRIHLKFQTDSLCLDYSFGIIRLLCSVCQYENTYKI